MELEKNLQKTTLQTGAFVVAWSWVLVYYSLWHALAGESPLQGQIGIGSSAEQKALPTLLMPYLGVCALAVWASAWLRQNPSPLSVAAVTAVEFFPSPVFNAALLSFLGQYSSGLQLCFLNIETVAAVAILVHFAPSSGHLGIFCNMIRNTVGFGLGVAWNSLVSRFEPIASNLVGLSLYLAVLMLLTLRLAAEPSPSESLRSRFWQLLSFAAKVVCAFTMADWLQAVRPCWQAWQWGFASLALQIVIAALASAAVARADFAAMQARAEEVRVGYGQVLMSMLTCIPCFWCCCPWIPILAVLSRGKAGVKERWLTLIADVSSLSSSIIGTNIITAGVDATAGRLGICNSEQCYTATFLLLELAAASLVSGLLLPTISQLVDLPESSLAPDVAVSLLEGASDAHS